MIKVPTETDFYIFMCINEGSSTAIDIYKKTNITHSHINKRIGDLEYEGYIKRVKIGRKKKVTLTTKGKQLLLRLSEALNPKT